MVEELRFNLIQIYHIGDQMLSKLKSFVFLSYKYINHIQSMYINIYQENES